MYTRTVSCKWEAKEKDRDRLNKKYKNTYIETPIDTYNLGNHAPHFHFEQDGFIIFKRQIHRTWISSIQLHPTEVTYESSLNINFSQVGK